MPKIIKIHDLNPIGSMRIRKGYSRKEVAKQLEITTQYLSQIEEKNAWRNPSIVTAEKLCKLYKCSMDELLHGESRRKQKQLINQ